MACVRTARQARLVISPVFLCSRAVGMFVHFFVPTSFGAARSAVLDSVVSTMLRGVSRQNELFSGYAQHNIGAHRGFLGRKVFPEGVSVTLLAVS